MQSLSPKKPPGCCPKLPSPLWMEEGWMLLLGAERAAASFLPSFPPARSLPLAHSASGSASQSKLNLRTAVAKLDTNVFFSLSKLF